MTLGRTIRFALSALFLALVLPLTAAGAADGFTFTREPLAIWYEDVELLPLSAVDPATFYVSRGGERIESNEPARIQADENGTSLRFELDGRAALIHISDGPEETLRVTFSLDAKGEFEKLGVQFRVTKTEGFYGLMERVVQGSQGYSWEPGMTEGLDLRGQTVDLYTLPTLSIYAPFFLSSAGYGVYVESNWPAVYRFGVDADGRTAPTEITIESEDPELSILLLPGPTPTDVIERYARIAGLPLMPPDFILGPGRWRDIVWDLPTFYDGTPYDGPFNSMIVEDVLMMEALDIPCGWIVVDRPWSSGSFGYGDMLFDEHRLPAFTDMIDWLDGRGIASLLWLGPWVMDGQREEAMALGYDVRPTIPYLPGAALLDFTNPEVVAWWKAELKPVFATGVAGFKLDRGEEKTPDGQVFRGSYFDGTSYREGHNAYPLWFAQTAYEAGIEAGQRTGTSDFVNLYRAGWTGSSQVTVAWGGDSDPSAWGLRSAIIGLQRAAILNTPIWGSDTGGYNTRPPREVLARWLAFSAFCPIMEVGPTANLAPWSWLPDDSTEAIGETGYTFDTIYDEELLAIWSFYANLHVELIETTRELAEQACLSGTPIVRPLIVAFPDRQEYVDAWGQYLYGPDLLVRPVWEPGADVIDVEVPPGTWVNAWTGDEYAGPTSIEVEVPLHAIPLFVRKGGPLMLEKLPARWEDALRRVAVRPDLVELIELAEFVELAEPSD